MNIKVEPEVVTSPEIMKTSQSLYLNSLNEEALISLNIIKTEVERNLKILDDLILTCQLKTRAKSSLEYQTDDSSNVNQNEQIHENSTLNNTNELLLNLSHDQIKNYPQNFQNQMKNTYASFYPQSNLEQNYQNFTHLNHQNLQENYYQVQSHEINNSLSKSKRGKRGKYVMYDEYFKSKCIEEVQRTGNEKLVAKIYNLPLKKLKRWLEVGPKRLEGGGRKVMDPEMEGKLVSWINFQFQSGFVLNGTHIQEKAKELSKVPKFLASKGWLEKFLRKFNIQVEK